MLLLDGRVLAKELKQTISADVATFKAEHGAPPCLTVIQIAGNAASDWYVRSIKKSCEGAGMTFDHRLLPETTSQSDLEQAIHAASDDATIHGIIIQMPLPKGLNADGAVAALDPRKDVDGLHPVNAGRLAQGLSALVPNTPAGGMALLDRYEIPLQGKHVVIVGRSNVVGKPLAQLCLARHATVTICHSRTTNLADVVKQGDIVAAAVGKAGLITGDMLKQGAVVLDFGINDIGDNQIVGDVDFASASTVASAITPVPGGTGPVTNMMLLQNTLQAAKWST